MEVLKDAASAAIYGAQAGNGVVLITTRKAKKGVRRISYDFQLSSQSLGRTPDILNAQEYVNYMTEGNLIPRETIDRYWDGKTNTDWVKETFESSMMQRHNVNFQGANDNGSLFASLSYLSNNGPIVGNKDVFDRITGTVNADYKVKDWLKFTTNNSFSRYHVQSVSEGSATGSLMLSAIQLDPLTPVTYTPDKLPDTMINYMNQGHTLPSECPMVIIILFPLMVTPIISIRILCVTVVQRKEMVLCSAAPLIWILLRLKSWSSLHVWDTVILTAIPTAMLCLTLPALTFIRTMYR